MARKAVRIDIPIRVVDRYIKLIDRVCQKHTQLGPASPLLNHPRIDMADFELKKSQALAFRNEARELDQRAQVLMEKSRVLLGMNAGQNINTEGTLYFTLDLIRGVLKGVHMGQEEALSEWGFNVVVSMVKGRKLKNKDSQKD
jgi:hypothetical protein